MNGTSPTEIVRVYVWEVPVRVTHWLIALSIAVLAATGFYIGNPFVVVTGQAGQHFLMGWTKVVHYYAALAFTLSVVARIAWMFRGNTYARWQEFIPLNGRRWSTLVSTLKFYLFVLRRPPAVVGHNPLAGLTYTLVFGLYLTAIATGLALYSVSAGPLMHRFAFLIPLVGGLQTARWIHHVVMWLLLGFAVHHVYSAVLVSNVEASATMDSIFSGYKFVSREHPALSGVRAPQPERIR